MYLWLKKIWTKSLSRQLMLGIALVHALLMTIFVFDLVSRQRDFLLGQSREQATGLAETLAANGASWVLSSDFIGMEEVILSQSGFPGLKYAIFVDLNNKVLAYTERDKVGKYISDPISLSLNKVSATTHVLIDNELFVDVAAPIVVNEKQIGWARVGISREGIADNLDIVTRNGLFYTSLAIFVGIIFAWFMAQGLTSAIRRLASNAHAVGQGKREVNFQLDRNDELGELSRDFDATVKILANNERELKTYQEHLEQLVKLRTRELQVANDELMTYSFKIEQDKNELEDSYQQLQKLQNQLIESEKMSALGALVAGVSHEINTPLGLTLTSVSYLQEQLKKNKKAFEIGRLSKGEFEDYLNNASEMTDAAMESIQRAITLVNSFKEVAVAETAKSFHCFSLSDYIQNILITYQNKFKPNAITVNCHINKDLMINSEPGLFSQILSNLINNSLRHGFETKTNGCIEIKAEKTAGKLLLSYQDNGQGMDQAQLKKLYEPFYTTKMGQGGSGLGMHIVYNIVSQRLHGSIKCVSEPGKGVCFVIKLPVQFEEKVKAPSQLLEE